MKDRAIARRYARALLALTIDAREEEGALDQLAHFAQQFSSHRDLRRTVTSPIYPLESRRKVVGTLLERLGITGPVRALVLLLLERGRLQLCPAVVAAYRQALDEHARRVRGEVISAEPLDEPALADIRQALERLWSCAVHLEARSDASLLAGTVTRIGSVVYDGSLRTRLELLREDLLRRRQGH